MRGYIFTTGLLAAGLLVSGCAGGSQSLSPASGSLVPQAAFAPAAATNAIVNGSFTTGKLAPWAAFGKGAGAGTVTDKQHYGNTKYAGFMGTLTTPAVNLPHGMSQTITVPKNGKLTFWHEG
ncbi:MAG TPA: hypothetical protein VMH02_01275, partial [Verrucomicrobiae bacterium]|nr:hypothetical protein [Verrucomicrobiae bacterium]